MNDKKETKTVDAAPSRGDLVEIYSKKGYAHVYTASNIFSFSSRQFSVVDGEIGIFLHRLSDEPTSILYQYGKVFFHKGGGATGGVLISNLRVLFTKDQPDGR